MRIALCELPRMVDDIICALVRDTPDADVVARIRRSRDLDRVGADLIVCCIAEPEMEALWHAVLRRRSFPAFLNLGADFTRGDLYGVRPTRRGLDDVTAQSLLEAFRRHAGLEPTAG